MTYPNYLQPNNPRFLAGLFIAIFILVSAFAMSSCNAEKKAIKKENAAIDLILSSRTKMARILPPILEVFPCLNDTVKLTDTVSKLVKGKTDTVPVLVPYLLYRNKGLDTIIKGVKLTIDTLGNVKMKVPQSTPDTLKIPVPYAVIDGRLLKNCNNSLNAKDEKLQDALMEAAGLETQLSDMSKWQIYFWVLVGVLALLFVLSQKSKFLNWLENRKL